LPRRTAENNLLCSYPFEYNIYIHTYTHTCTCIILCSYPFEFYMYYYIYIYIHMHTHNTKADGNSLPEAHDHETARTGYYVLIHLSIISTYIYTHMHNTKAGGNSLHEAARCGKDLDILQYLVEIGGEELVKSVTKVHIHSVQIHNWSYPLLRCIYTFNNGIP
jgi:hypothetical protein